MSLKPAKAAPKSTLASRPTANPRRTTLASVADFGQLPGVRSSQEPVEYPVELPTQTANPRRTILMTLPEQQRA
ncbi:hypothetical protein ACIGXM_32515 [Kitasatospora sp. NPDC052896]|uniref:hypothetical protein n=1 Tax=Kitasatospora sp. NPDC052896 TaxID=3364061 RepID=UPI0037CA4B5A